MQQKLLKCLPQLYLQNGGTLQSLVDTHAIKIKRHLIYPNLVQLCYNQIESPMDNPLVQQCRGLILDEDTNWAIVAWPFNKFFNYGEQLASKLNWDNDQITIQEKLDGSLMILYNYKNRWMVGTSGTPDASGKVGDLYMSFGELFWQTFNDAKMSTPASLHAHCTFMFELVSPLNRVVVHYLKSYLRLIGKRDIRTGLELPIDYHCEYNPVKQYRMRTMEDVLKTFKTMNPLEQEGYVLRNAVYDRVKVKHPGYIKLHHLRSSFSVKNVLEIIRSGETTEVLASFPEWRETFDVVQAAYEGYIAAIENDWNKLEPRVSNGFSKHPLCTRKDFAAVAQTTTHPPTMFLLLDDTVKNARESVNKIHIDTLVDTLGLRSLVGPSKEL